MLSPVRRLGVVLTVMGLALLAVTWAFSNPPLAAPDEPQSIVKAVGTAYGDMSGDDEPYPPYFVFFNERGRRWYTTASRSFTIPDRYARLNGLPCFASTDLPTTCEPPRGPESDRMVTTASPQATYVPLFFAPAGFALRFAPDADTGIRLGRLATAVTSLALLGFAIALAVPGDRKQAGIRLAGLAIATTPMVLFLTASISTNGIEAAAAILTWTAALRLAGRPTNAAWTGLTVGGTALALSRMLDPGFLAVVALVVAVLAGRDRVRTFVRGPRRRRANIALGCIAAASLFTATWDHFVVPQPSFSRHTTTDALRSLLSGDTLVSFGRQTVGMFDWIGYALPLRHYLVWAAPALLLVVVAFVLGTRRERLALTAVVAAFVAGYFAVGVVEYTVGFGMQARLVEPLLVGIPLLAAHVLAAHTDRIPRPRLLATGVVAATASVHVSAIAWNIGRWTWDRTVPGPTAVRVWAAPGGNALWFALATLAAAMLVAGTAAATADR